MKALADKVASHVAAHGHELTFGAGALLASIGTGLIYAPAGLILAGVLLMAIAWQSARTAAPVAAK